MRAITHVTIDLNNLHKALSITSLNERQIREFSGFLANEIGYGGVLAVSRALKISPITVRKGRQEFLKLSENKTDNKDRSTENCEEQTSDLAPATRIRRVGAGRKSVLVKQPKLQATLQALLEASTYGDPMRVIVWTTLSLRKIQEELAKQGFKISHTVVGELIEQLGYSKQVNQKMLQTSQPHPDRDEQFRFINEKSKSFLAENLPVISVDCKKKVNIGNFKNPGAEFRPKSSPRKVLNHDFPLKELGKVAPYGVYVLNDNTGFINLGVSADTGEFAAESVGRWWHAIGQENFPAKKLYIICDGGGSNGSKVRLWKFALAQMAELCSLEIHVSHLPPGTSKWNKVEHRLFCYISKNWQGQALVDIETVVSLISSTTTKKGLKVNCEVDKNTYNHGIKISDKEFAKVDIERIGEFGQWNYIIRGFKDE